MKPLFLALLLVSASAFAVSTKNCPETIEVQLTELSLNSLPDDNFEPEDRNDFPFDGWNGPGMIRLAQELRAKGTVSAVLKLQYKANAKCNYRGEDAQGEYVSARLEGSTRANATNKAKLVVYSGDLAVYLPVSKVAKTGLTGVGTYTSLYYRGEYCSWGDCIPDHIQIGNAKVFKLR